MSSQPVQHTISNMDKKKLYSVFVLGLLFTIFTIISFVFLIQYKMFKTVQCDVHSVTFGFYGSPNDNIIEPKEWYLLYDLSYHGSKQKTIKYGKYESIQDFNEEWNRQKNSTTVSCYKSFGGIITEYPKFHWLFIISQSTNLIVVILTIIKHNYMGYLIERLLLQYVVFGSILFTILNISILL